MQQVGEIREHRKVSVLYVHIKYCVGICHRVRSGHFLLCPSVAQTLSCSWRCLIQSSPSVTDLPCHRILFAASTLMILNA